MKRYASAATGRNMNSADAQAFRRPLSIHGTGNSRYQHCLPWKNSAKPSASPCPNCWLTTTTLWKSPSRIIIFCSFSTVSNPISRNHSCTFWNRSQTIHHSEPESPCDQRITLRSENYPAVRESPCGQRITLQSENHPAIRNTENRDKNEETRG